MGPNPSGRVQVVQHPQALPAVCAVCGVGARKNGFADFGLSYEFYGAFYLCCECVYEVARAFGCASPEETAEIKAQSVMLNVEVEALAERVKELEDVLGKRMFQLADSFGANGTNSIDSVTER